MTHTVSARGSSVPPAAFAELVLNEARLAWRTPRGIALGVGMPLLLLVLFGELPHFKEHPASLGGLTLFDAEVPVLAALLVAALALLSLPSPLASYREQGILRRMSTTPVRPAWMLAGQIVINFVLAALALVILFVLGVAAFGVAAPKAPGGLALSLLLCVLALFAVGLFIVAIAPGASSVGYLGGAAFFPLIFFAGLWIPLQQMPDVLRQIASYTALGAAVQAAQESMQTGFPPARPLLVMAGWGAVFGLAAWRFFRWE